MRLFVYLLLVANAASIVVTVVTGRPLDWWTGVEGFNVGWTVEHLFGHPR